MPLRLEQSSRVRSASSTGRPASSGAAKLDHGKVQTCSVGLSSICLGIARRRSFPSASVSPYAACDRIARAAKLAFSVLGRCNACSPDQP